MVRSDPLTILRTGEPRLLPGQIPPEDKLPWLLLVTNLKTGRQKRKLLASYVDAKGRAEAIWDALNRSPDFDVTVISRSVGYGPPYSKITDLQLLNQNTKRWYWCPYCRKFRRLLPDPKRGMKRLCMFCHLGEGDFHFLRCNPTFWSAAARYRIHHPGG